MAVLKGWKLKNSDPDWCIDNTLSRNIFSFTANFVAPVILNATKFTKHSCNITWEEYDDVNWNAPYLFYYNIFIEEVGKLNNNFRNYPLFFYKSFHLFGELNNNFCNYQSLFKSSSIKSQLLCLSGIVN